MKPLILLLALTTLALPASASAAEPLRLDLLGRGAPQGEAGAEIAAFHPDSRRAFVTNAAANALDIYSLRNPAAPVLLQRVDLSPYGGGPNSVDVRSDGLVAVVVEGEEATDRGSVQLFNVRGRRLGAFRAGALPDMVTFAGRGRWLLVANEGEPASDGSVDPEGSVTVVDLRRGGVRHARFGGVPLRGDVRIFGPGASPAQDLEPEYIAEGKKGEALVTLQENNAVGVLDIEEARFRRVRGLGYKDHGRARNALDPSDRDGGPRIAPFANVFGMYQPDAVASYSLRGRPFFVTANEGDARDYDYFSEEERVKDLRLDPQAFPGDAKSDAKLGRLTVTNTMGDRDGDGDFDEVYAFGARSLSVLDEEGRVAYDTGSELERFTALTDPATFNADQTADSAPDVRSDNKGPEPEGVDVGKVRGRQYAFLGSERQGGLFAYDLEKVRGQARLAGYANTRPGDLGPESLRFVPAADSPTRQPLLLVTNEITGTLTVLAVRRER